MASPFEVVNYSDRPCLSIPPSLSNHLLEVRYRLSRASHTAQRERFVSLLTRRIGPLVPVPTHHAIATGPGVKGVWVDPVPISSLALSSTSLTPRMSPVLASLATGSTATPLSPLVPHPNSETKSFTVSTEAATFNYLPTPLT